MTGRKSYYLRVQEVDEETGTATIVVNTATIERIVDAFVERPIPEDPQSAEADGQIATKLQAVHGIITPTNYPRLHP